MTGNNESYTSSAFLPNEKDSSLTKWTLETKEILEDMFNMFENKTMYNDETETFFRKKGDEPLIDKKSMSIIRLILRTITSKSMALSFMDDRACEKIANELTKKIQYVLLENIKENKLTHYKRSSILYNIQTFILSQLNKAIKWKTLEESSRARKTIEALSPNSSDEKMNRFSFGRK